MAAYARHRPVRSIAVVANAPLEPDPVRAAAIDDCDLVIRVNGFRLDEPDGAPCVGSRVDTVVFTRGAVATPWLFREYQRRLYLLVEPGRMHWEPESWPDWWPTDLGFVPVPNRSVVVPLAEELGLAMRDRPRWATTGTTAIWLALVGLPRCQVKIAGYSFIDNPDQTSWAHAYGDDCGIPPEHELLAESRLIRDWVDSGRLHLLT